MFCGTHVAVDDLERQARLVFLLVGVVKPLRGLGDDPRAYPRRDTRRLRLRPAHQASEVAPLDVLHGEEQPFVAEVLKLVDLDDVRVIETRRQTRLLDEHRAKAPRRAVRRQDALEDEDLEGSFGAPLLGEEYLRHSARPEAAHDLELSDLSGRGRRRELGHHAPSPESIIGCVFLA